MRAKHVSSEQEAEDQFRDNEPLLQTKLQLGDLKLAEAHISIGPDGADAARFAFRSGARPWRDTVFSCLFFATVGVTYAFGFFAVWNAEFDQEAQLRFARYNPESRQCENIKHPHVGNTPTHFALIHGRKDSEEAASSGNVGVIFAPVLTTLVLVFPLGLAVLWLLHRYTREIVLAVLALMCAIPVTVGVVLSTVCLTSKTACSEATIVNSPMSIQFAVVICVSLVMLVQFVVVCKNRSRLDLTIQILQTALRALKQNLSLLLLNPVLFLAMVVVNAPIVVFTFYAYGNGRVAPDFDVVRDPSHGCSQATGAPCCQFKQAGWVTPYLVLAYVVELWVALVASQLQILVVSGTISQWYFAPTGSSTVGTTKQAMRNAIGPSFGTACLSALMMTISSILKSLMDKVGAKIGQGIVSVFLRACFSWLFQIFEFFTRFSTNFAAISGDSFCTSARATYELLKRNLLSTLIVEVLVGYVLSGTFFVVSLAHFFIVFGAIRYFTTADPWVSLVTANACFVISLLGMSQVCTALSTVIDTVYICYAMDKDVGSVSKREVHDVYMLLPPTSSGDETMLAVRRSEP